MAKKNKLSKKKIKPKKPALHSETKKGIAVVVCFTLALVSILSYFKTAGAFGQYFLKASRLFFGQGFFLIPLSFILAGLGILRSFHRRAYGPVFVGLAIFILSILGFFHIFTKGEAIESYGGGYIGLLFGYPLEKFLGFWAALIILSALLLISILVTFNIPLRREKAKAEKAEGAEGPEEKKLKEEETPQAVQFFETVQPEAKEPLSFIEPEKKPGLLERWKTKVKTKIILKEPAKDTGIKKEETEDGSREFQIRDPEAAKPFLKGLTLKSFKGAAGPDDFKFPPLDVLEKDRGEPTSGDIKANQNIIKRTLGNFGIEVEMAEANIGPTVTQYTLRPAQGVKLSKITALQNDLALALAVHPLRIEAPIPGRALVGIEIPNRTTVLVRLRNLLEHSAFKELSQGLSLALGRGVSGRPVFANLVRMPHLLIAGATGAGKTISLNSLIISLLYQNTPQTLKFILIDPKRVEFASYNGLPHLLTPVIVQSDKAVNALRWATAEMERRFDILQENGARDIAIYNRRQPTVGSQQPLPYIVIIIDELADLMAARGREVEAVIVRLAQMARAVGIHLVVSTQRPSVEVITGLIKANITSRIAFQVASQVDSRTILDMAGAEKLLGHGDMLYLAGDAGKPRRIQGTFVSDKEIKRVANYIRKTQRPDYDQTIVGIRAENRVSRIEAGNPVLDDELYEEAKEVIIEARRASASLLQRRLRVGYARAARLLDILEENGVIGPANGAKPREVLTAETEDRI